MFKKFHNKQYFAFTLLLSACAAGITGCGSKSSSSASSEMIMESSTFSDAAASSETISTEASEVSSATEISESSEVSVPAEATDMPEASEPTEASSEAELDNTSDPTEALAAEIVADNTAEKPEESTINSSSDFYYTSIPDSIKAKMIGVSYPADTANALISMDSLSYVHVLHVDFNGNTQTGELICNTAIAQDLVDIFKSLYEAGYPIDKIRLIDEYGADDDTSMAADNTSCFNYRLVKGSNKLSNHGLGRAIDLNPLYNPCVYLKSGEVAPSSGAAYADRSADFPYKIDTNDLAYKLFTQHGFTWGGSWNSLKDYQHFEKK